MNTNIIIFIFSISVIIFLIYNYYMIGINLKKDLLKINKDCEAKKFKIKLESIESCRQMGDDFEHNLILLGLDPEDARKSRLEIEGRYDSLYNSIKEQKYD